jgi:hypothetical protein
MANVLAEKGSVKISKFLSFDKVVTCHQDI